MNINNIFSKFTVGNWLTLIGIIITFVSVLVAILSAYWSVYTTRQKNKELIKSNEEENKDNKWYRKQIAKMINNQIKSNKKFLEQFKGISLNIHKSFIQTQKEDALIAIRKFRYIWKIYLKAKHSKNKNNKYSYMRQVVKLYSAWRNYLIENIAYRKIIIDSIKNKKTNRIQSLYNYF